jgi:hypothetical protein
MGRMGCTPGLAGGSAFVGRQAVILASKTRNAGRYSLATFGSATIAKRVGIHPGERLMRFSDPPLGIVVRAVGARGLTRHFGLSEGS